MLSVPKFNVENLFRSQIARGQKFINNNILKEHGQRTHFAISLIIKPEKLPHEEKGANGRFITCKRLEPFV